MKKYLGLFIVSFLGVLMALGVFSFYLESKNEPVENVAQIPTYQPASFNSTATNIPALRADAIDFTSAAEKTVNSVVHVRNVSISKGSGNRSVFDFFYGGNSTKERTQIGTGSGVIISPDGYIVTNNHVIDKASTIEITLNNNKKYKAELIGTDPSTDIALIKINPDEKLPFLVFGNSDNAKIGEWVLAVGNPFNLTSTVTAGIVSAKARDLDERDRQNQSFIQTDAAVNPGNSGGALVNINGDLIGINTAITSQTGSFVGYAFAVPSNIAKKVVDDLLEYGVTQKGLLGISGAGLDSDTSKRFNVDDTEGIYISDVVGESGAEKAGLKTGDIIKKIDGLNVNKFSDLTGYIASKRPKDVVNVTIKRDGDLKIVPVTLLKDLSYRIQKLRIVVQNLSKETLKKYDLNKGVIISDVDYQRQRPLLGQVILEIDGKDIESVDDVRELFKSYDVNQGPSTMVLIDENGVKERINF